MGTLALIYSISCHSNDLNTFEYDNLAQVGIFLTIYALHYYIFYMLLFRGFEKQLQDHNEAFSKDVVSAVNHDFSVSCENKRGLGGFLMRRQRRLDFFYCFDIPVGTHAFLNSDWKVLLVMRWQMQIKILMASIIAMQASKK
jgi:hypothetical protein